MHELRVLTDSPPSSWHWRTKLKNGSNSFVLTCVISYRVHTHTWAQIHTEIHTDTDRDTDTDTQRDTDRDTQSSCLLAQATAPIIAEYVATVYNVTWHTTYIYLNPFNASCSKSLLFKPFSAILV